MVISLKIILAIIILCCIMIGFFTFKEYKLWVTSKQTEENSMFERFLVYFLIFCAFLFSCSIGILSIIFILSEINIKLPW